MEKYLHIIMNAYHGYANYLLNEISHVHVKNYFYWLIGISLFFFLLELIKPWRKDQPKLRRDFWLDFFYIFFNFFLFSLIIYNAGSDVFVNLFNDFLSLFSITNLVAIEISSWAVWVQLLTMLILRDFIQWWIHRLLHWSPFLWEFHIVHHSVEEMGFAAHLRYHWMDTIVYHFIEYLPLAIIGFGIDVFFILHIIGLSIGHFNHSNFSFNPGPLKYIFNNPAMHIWHHAYEMPEERKFGINFGVSLILWDYLFGTAVIPGNGRDIKLGFPGLEKFPKCFISQALHGFRKSD